jgi:nicotinic acid mononucleotide adenylyltransferase
MADVLIKELFEELFRNEEMQKYEINREDIQSLNEAPGFREKLSSMIKASNFQAITILDLFLNRMQEIEQMESAEKTLKEIYHFCQYLSFPESRPKFERLPVAKKKLFYLFLLTYRFFLSRHYQHNKKSFLAQYPLAFLSTKEIRVLEQPEEYRNFLNAFDTLFVHEMMALSKEIYEYNTLEHICGVHALALSIGRQIQKQGLPVDLGVISGSAAGHDIGKYGCRYREQERVPYLHYYYTDIWFHKYNIPYIGHIAVNHSVWDLELENLSLESLILIYSDFRVKNKENSGEMYIYSLNESFQVILKKLDNVDERKEKRYRRVFDKLKDFEDFLIEKGVEVKANPLPGKDYKPIRKARYFALLHGKDVIQQSKYLSLEHSFQLMHQLRNETSINSILESARSDGNWQNVQEYLRIFSEYAAYLNQKEKLLVLKFLYEQLIFPEEGVRRRGAKLIGYLIANFDEQYRKEIPEDMCLIPPEVRSTKLLEKYIGLFLEPSYKTSELSQSRVRDNLPFMIETLFEYSQIRQKAQYLNIIKKFYQNNYDYRLPLNHIICLLQTLKSIPVLPGETFDPVFSDFLIYFIFQKEYTLSITALDVMENMLDKISEKDAFRNKCYSILKARKECSLIPAENYLKYKIINKLNIDSILVNHFHQYCQQDEEKIDRMYLNNLKSSTEAIIKKVQIDMLKERAIANKEETVYTALHFCNILKVSSHEPIRNYAGNALITIVPYLTVEQKNDISIELLKALEIDDYQYTKYIPYYLGQSIPFLPPREIDEFIDDLEEKIKIADQWSCTLLIRTIAVAISRYAPYQDRYVEQTYLFQDRLNRMLGILMNGLAHHNSIVRRVTSRVIGKEIFASRHLSLSEKEKIFRFIAKKLLNLVTPISQQDNLLFFVNTVSLHQIYIFISNYNFSEGSIKLPVPKSIAFFPGTFDPFSLSHKQIVREIERLGMEVYLSVDEFSWSKRTQPHLFRKHLINMSIADELNVYLYPENLPSNIANPLDLEELKKQFPDSITYIVAGSDVLLNASAYREAKENSLIFGFPHIIFGRKGYYLSEQEQENYQRTIEKFFSNVIHLNLQAPFEDISSSQIRKNIDEHRDISDLVDPLIERYIYQMGLYQREPQYKSTLQKVYTKVEVVEDFDDSFLEKLVMEVFSENVRGKALKSLQKFNQKLNPRLILLHDTRENEKILGFAAVHWVRASELYYEFEDNIISQHIRDSASGRTIIIDGVFTRDTIRNYEKFKNYQQIVLTEALTFCIRKDYDYAVFKSMLPEVDTNELINTLELFGFTRLSITNPRISTIMTVDIRKPCTISLDIETLIKEPFVHKCRIMETINLARQRLQRAMTHLYPGHLLIPFDIDLINQAIVTKICQENSVPTEQNDNRQLGPLMCVPFGKILHKMVVPNTVTKSLHTDKIFSPDMKHFKIDSFGYYMSLENQVKMIKSFNRPVLLIDDLLHKGYRLKALCPILNKENIKVHKIIVGLLSARGKELATIQKRLVDSAYFIPNLRVWFNESDLCPFIGGDGLYRTEPEQGSLVRSINMILPYAYPVFLKEVDLETIYQFSEICIENAIQIVKALEEEYQADYHRKLTLQHLGEVLIYPRYPDHGKHMDYNLSLSTSMYLANDLELLRRIWGKSTKNKQGDLLRFPYSREFTIGREEL